VFFAAGDPAMPAVREAMGELLAHRRAQAARTHERCFQEYAGKRGYLPGESKREFLTRHGARPGTANPQKMPYYLLLVGSPEEIPWSFQSELDVQYAVGRICFDTPQEYAAYAQSVVAAETSRPLRRRRVVVFAPHHHGDVTTQLSARDIAIPLAEHLIRRWPDWEIATAFGEQATKARLASLVDGDDLAALLFTAGHGLGYPSGHPLQRGRQGALLCQDFPGVGCGGRVAHEHCFAADDVANDARLHGLVTFHLACYSAGAPAVGEFPPGLDPPRARVAPRAFLSRLAQRLVGHRRGGALAVVGQIEKPWPLALEWPGASCSLPAFAEAFDRLADGKPVGYAMAAFGERHAAFASDLAAELEVVRCGVPPDDETLSRLWAVRNDCRHYVVIGDPAVRLAIDIEPNPCAELDWMPGAAVN
ncbi:MAG TPA: C25 family cysteine peptidase, partial [Thermoanaerobaculia bacterium]|nr:C25 family cysteine peptidase [Thermoanaerobaculia bacterium]